MTGALFALLVLGAATFAAVVYTIANDVDPVPFVVGLCVLAFVLDRTVVRR